MRIRTRKSYLNYILLSLCLTSFISYKVYFKTPTKNFANCVENCSKSHCSQENCTRSNLNNENKVRKSSTTDSSTISSNSNLTVDCPKINLFSYQSETTSRQEQSHENCPCMGKILKLRSQGLLGSFHCDKNGLFEALQCDSDSGFCFCCDLNGNRIGGVVPEHLWKDLECYSGEKSYLRPCEQEWVNQEKLMQEISIYGIKIDEKTLKYKEINCTFDGNYLFDLDLQNITSKSH